MSRTHPKEKRRGGARDDSELYIDYTLDELTAMLERRRRRSEEFSAVYARTCARAYSRTTTSKNILNSAIAPHNKATR